MTSVDAELLKNPLEDGVEDGEITDDEDCATSSFEVSTELDAVRNYEEDDNGNSSGDEYPEEILNVVAQKAFEKSQQKAVSIEQKPPNDPKLCVVCQKKEHKYRCPRCDVRSCSLGCSKQHKTDSDCDGVRQAFCTVNKLSQFDAQKSIDDQKFFHAIKEAVGLQTNEGPVQPRNEENLGKPSEEIFEHGLRCKPNSSLERYLMNAARFRRIWLGFSDENKPNESRHEQFSDTIFWNIDIIFRKQTEEGFSDYSKTIVNIPDSIRLVTVLKQFFKPRKFGMVVSESDLDLEKLEPFISRGIEGVNVFMPVHSLQNKFYGILPDQSLLENLRNKIVVDYPTLVVTLDNEFLNIEIINKDEAEAVFNKFGGFSMNSRGGFPRGGGQNFGGHRGDRRGRGGQFNRGGFTPRGGSHHVQQRFQKRSFGGDGNDQPQWKRGRGGPGHRNSRGNFNRLQNNRHQPPAEGFDPFEPFEGPITLPMEYGNSGAKSSYSFAVPKRND
ncbi:unnamed protein product [Caenorhabditis auriculariae]|uniref:Box C/D snoRNA protein 1 n=1 Tax=Caenorhabditis auriculariae TaxID=2777116 RepID=A0A8S1HPT0_9PELO|nr:unnamed protein product [Caenorhabditis auriculariae]